MSASSTRRFEFGDLILDLGRRQLFRGDEPIRLTKLNFELLRALVTAAPNLVTRESLATAVWGPDRVITPENLSQRIMALRRQLDDEATRPRYVEGIRGQGYRLIPPVKASSEPGEAQRSVEPARGRPRPRLPNSVAVLPLENLSPDPKHVYFATGLHAEIIKHLSRLKNVNTIARTSMRAYAGSSMPVSEIAAELGVETILEGSVRYQGDCVRISVNLTEPKFGISLWSETYERDLVDVFKIETDIAVNVADALRAELMGGEPRLAPRRPAVSTEAYALYMQALGLFVMRETGERMNELLDRALELDPEFPEAYGLSAYSRATSYTDAMNQDAIDAAHRSALEDVVREYAQRALDLDPNVAIAHAAVAMVDLVTWRWGAACRRFSRAHELGWSLDISPWLYSWMDRHDEAIARARRVVELSPRDWVRYRHLGVALAYARKYADALRVLRCTESMAPAEPLTLAWILFVQIAQGKRSEASETAKVIERILGDSRPFVILPELAYAYQRLGRPSDVQRVFDEIRAVAERRDIGTGAHAMAHLAIGDHDSALDRLEAAAVKIRNHEPDPSAVNLLNLKMNFMADPVLEQPRFRQALRTIRGDSSSDVAPMPDFANAGG